MEEEPNWGLQDQVEYLYKEEHDSKFESPIEVAKQQQQDNLNSVTKQIKIAEKATYLNSLLDIVKVLTSLFVNTFPIGSSHPP